MSPTVEAYLLLICGTVLCSKHALSTIPHKTRRQAPTEVQCLTASGGGGVCKPLRQCQKEMKNFVGRRPAVCRWETIGPVICCPSSQDSNALTCGLSQLPDKRSKRQVSLDGEREGGSNSQTGVGEFVIGGKDAILGKWPWMALIFLADDTERKVPICGAALISDSQVVTAAHCFEGVSDSTFVVQLGLYDVGNSTKEAGVAEIKVKRIILHPNFTYPSIYNDIALLQLQTRARLSNKIQTVCLPGAFKADDFAGKKATVTGWGQKEFGGPGAKIMQEVELSVFTNADCNGKYETLPGASASLPRGVQKPIICAGSATEAKDACPGDSGGPLVIQSPAGNWVLIGIVSAGFMCGQQVPGLYTRVTEYVDWISTNSA